MSVLHSFFGWATAEDLIEVDPSAPLRRPKKRRADVYRPSVDELAADARGRAAARAAGDPAHGGRRTPSGRGAERAVGRCRSDSRPRARVPEGRELAARPTRAGRARRSSARASASCSPSSTTTCSRSRSSSGSRSTSASASGRTRRCRRASRRSGAWCSASAGAPASASSRRTSCATASRTASSARAGATLPRCRPLLGHSRIDTTQLYTDEIEVDELAAALAAGAGGPERTSVAGSGDA